jgi:hypothetical protein
VSEPEEVLRIAASQWDKVPNPEQIISALRAGGFEITRTGGDPTSLLVPASCQIQPLETVREIMIRRKLTLGGLASKVGIAPSTLTRAMNDQGHKFTLSTKTLNKIIEWDATTPVGAALEGK